MDSNGVGIMSDEGEIAPDFNLKELLNKKEGRQAWESSEMSNDDLDQKPEMSVPLDDTDVESKAFANHDKLEKLKKFLSSKEKRGKKRDRTPSPSEPTDTETSDSEKTKRTLNYISPSKIVKIFGNKITSAALCELSAISRATPREIRKIIPGATIQQICKMCDLWEASDKSSYMKHRRSRTPKRERRRSSKRRRRRKPKVPSKPKRSREKVSKRVEKKAEPKQEAQDTAFPVPTPKETE